MLFLNNLDIIQQAQPQYKYNKINKQICLNSFVSSTDTVSFKGLMKKEDKANLKMCVYDLDDTLLLGPQEIRNKVLDFSAENGKTLVYSTGRPLIAVKSLIGNASLTMPDYFVGDEGLNIYKKNQHGILEEMPEWSEELGKKTNFDSAKVREIMKNVAAENMFENAKKGSKIVEYEGTENPLKVYYVMASGVYEKTRHKIEQSLQEQGIQGQVKYLNLNEEKLNFLAKSLSEKTLEDLKNKSKSRLKPDGSFDVAIVTPKSDKGTATEYLRKISGFSQNQILSAGDAENDISHTNKGYWFVMVGNAENVLREAVKGINNIFAPVKSGNEGIWEVIEP